MAPKLKFLLLALFITICMGVYQVWVRYYKPQQVKLQVIEVPAPAFAISKTATTVILKWSNLPKGTVALKIYRANGLDGSLEYWQTINIDGSEGSIEISGDENFFYNLVGVDSEGQTTWNSEIKNALGDAGAAGASSTGTPSTTSQGGGNQNNSSQSSTPNTNPQPSTNPTSSNPNTTPTSTNPGQTSTSTPDYGSSTIYYKPNGEISAIVPNTPRTEKFGVQHLDKRINIWWNDLPSETEGFVVFRATDPNGQWNELMRQTQPRATDQVSLLDFTISVDHYYRMEVLDNGVVIATYGPVFLQGLSN